MTLCPYQIKTFSPKLCKLEILDDESAIKGYASVFNNKDSYDEIVLPGAFKKTLSEGLKSGRIKFADSHRAWFGTEFIHGILDDGHEDETGLAFNARISKTEPAQNMLIKVKEKILNALSIGYDIVKDEYDEEKKILYLKELKLYEVSVVAWGANPKAVITGAKGLLSLKELDGEERAILVKILKALTGEESDPSTLEQPAAEPTDVDRLLESMSGLEEFVDEQRLLTEWRQFGKELSRRCL